MPSIIIQAKRLIPFVSVLVALIIVIEYSYFSPMILRPSRDGHVHMRVLSNVNNMASTRAKIDFCISLPFSYGFQRIRAGFKRMGSQSLCFSVCSIVITLFMKEKFCRHLIPLNITKSCTRQCWNTLMTR